MKRLSRIMATAAFCAAAWITGIPATSSATPAYNPPGMDVGAAPTPTINGIMVPSLFGSTPNWNLSPALEKFVDNLPGLCSSANLNNPAVKCIPVAVPDTTTYPGSDYYEIKIVQYTEKLHRDLGPTTLRGYVQTNGPNGAAQIPRYLGPIIQAKKDRSVRIKFTNDLPVGTEGKLFLPVDTTVMGSGKGPLTSSGNTCTWALAEGTMTPVFELGSDCASYTQNRADLHLHGGLSPWISDGTPHQWIIPAGEYPNTPYKQGVSAVNVPDMPDPGSGSMTYYYTNQQSARMMFYHDHTYGLTRLNVYAGEAAGYLIRDDIEQSLIDTGIIPGTKSDGTTVVMGGEIPLVIQDKNFVDPATIKDLDPTWAWGTKADPLATTNATGDLWWPHVYMPAENPYDLGGVNPMGRWVYGLWFWPPTTGIPFQLKPNPYYDPACVDGPEAPGCVASLAYEPPQMPSVPNPSWTAEAFMDTMLVNGAAYPKVTLDPKTYRLRILNAAHDRFLNLQLYVATTTIKGCTVSGGTGYQVGDLFTFTGGLDGTKKYAQAAEGSVTEVDANGAITGFRVDNFGSHYTSIPTGFVADTTDLAASGAILSGCDLQQDTEVAMVPAVNYREYNKLNKDYIPNDYREGGVPDPTTAGPSWIQIGTEGGFLAKPAVIPPYPVTFLTDPTQFNVGNVIDGSLRMGPAERADVIVDLSAYAGKTLILYNDAPAAYPAAVVNNDYYTGAPDLRDSGGHAGPQPGFSPNTRTVMQITVNAGSNPPFNLTALQDQFKATANGGSVFQKGQEPIIVGQTAYNETYFTPASGTKFPATFPNWGMSEIGDNALNFKQPDGTLMTVPMEPKAIHDEMGAVYDEYGRMSAKLGVEVPVTNNLNQTFIMQNYVDPPTEIVNDGQIQIWKITHNGVDTHPMHFHLFDVQLINRVGWDGFKRLPDPNELGWKETVRVSPLEDTIVALKPKSPKLPFGLPNSVRKMQPALPDNTTQGFTNLYTSEKVPGDGLVGQAKAGADIDANQLYNYGDEYVWHCHILSHEEQDMMRPIRFNVNKVLPDAPTNLVAAGLIPNRIDLRWNDPTPVNYATRAGFGNPQAEIGFKIQRSENGGAFETLPVTILANTTSFFDTDVAAGTTYSYRVLAFNAEGDSPASDPAQLVAGTITAYTVTPTTGMGGLVTPTAPLIVDAGNTASFTISAIPGYYVTTATGCNGSVNGKTYTTGPVTGDCTVNVTFAKADQMFSEAAYLAANLDVAAAVKTGQFSSGWQHYELFGRAAGRQLAPLGYGSFNEATYLLANPDVAAVVSAGGFVNGWQHYDQFGRNENRPLAPAGYANFDEEAYRAANPDVAAAIKAGTLGNGWQHYDLFGRSEGRPLMLPSYGAFREHEYLLANPDVAAAVQAGIFPTGWQHYNTLGRGEGRKTRPVGYVIYSEAGYLAANPDVAAAVIAGTLTTGYDHYIATGKNSGLPITPPDYANFNDEAYLAANPDVAAAVKAGSLASGWQHYDLFGRNEGRPFNPSSYGGFNESDYLAANPDILQAVVNGIFASGWQHYDKLGRTEGRAMHLRP